MHSKAVDRVVRRVCPVCAAAKAPHWNLATGTEMLHLHRVLRDGLLGRDVNRMRAPPAAAAIA